MCIFIVSQISDFKQPDEGYSLDESNNCTLNCPLDCADGECEFDYVGNSFCACNKGFALGSNSKCEFICPLDCQNGECKYDFMGNPICACNKGRFIIYNCIFRYT